MPERLSPKGPTAQESGSFKGMNRLITGLLIPLIIPLNGLLGVAPIISGVIIPVISSY